MKIPQATKGISIKGPLRLVERHGVHYGQEGREGEIGGSAPGYKHAAGGENWVSMGRGKYTKGKFMIQGEAKPGWKNDAGNEDKGGKQAIFSVVDDLFMIEYLHEFDSGFIKTGKRLFLDAESAIAHGNKWVEEGWEGASPMSDEIAPGEAVGNEPWQQTVNQPGPTTVYRGVAKDNVKKILENGMNRGREWFGRPPSVYFTDEYREAIRYMLGENPQPGVRGGQSIVVDDAIAAGKMSGAIVEFAIPDDSDKEVLMDELHLGQSWRIEDDLPAEWITKVHLFEGKPEPEVITRAEPEGKTYYAWVNFEPEEEGEVGQDDEETAQDQDELQEPQAQEELGVEKPVGEGEGPPQPQPGMGSKDPPMAVAPALSEELKGYYSAEATDGDLMEAPEIISAGVSAGNTTEMWHELALDVLRQQPEDVQAKIAQVEADIRGAKVHEVEEVEEVEPEVEEVKRSLADHFTDELTKRHGVHYGQEGREGQVGGSAPGYEHAAGGENWTASPEFPGVFTIENTVKGNSYGAGFMENPDYPDTGGEFVLEMFFTSEGDEDWTEIGRIYFSDADLAIAAGNRYITEGNEILAEELPGEIFGGEGRELAIDIEEAIGATEEGEPLTGEPIEIPEGTTDLGWVIDEDDEGDQEDRVRLLYKEYFGEEYTEAIDLQHYGREALVQWQDTVGHIEISDYLRDEMYELDLEDETHNANMRRVEELDGLMERGKAPIDMVVYRGGSEMEWEVGDEFQDKSFVSTSFTSHEAVDFAFRDDRPDGAVYRMKIPKGSQGLAMDPIMDPKKQGYDEDEWVVPRNTTFKVVSAGEQTVYRFGKMHQIPAYDVELIYND